MIYRYDAENGTVTKKVGIDSNGVITEKKWSCYMGKEALPEVMALLRVVGDDISSEDLQWFAVRFLETRIEHLEHILGKEQ